MLSSKKSSFSDLENAEIVYLKEKVTINPTQYAADRISGKLKLIKQDSSLFMVIYFHCKNTSSINIFILIIFFFSFQNRLGCLIKAESQMLGFLKEVFVYIYNYI